MTELFEGALHLFADVVCLEEVDEAKPKDNASVWMSCDEPLWVSECVAGSFFHGAEVCDADEEGVVHEVVGGEEAGVDLELVEDAAAGPVRDGEPKGVGCFKVVVHEEATWGVVCGWRGGWRPLHGVRGG